MLNVDPMIKLAVVVAIGISVTMLLGVGERDEQNKLMIIHQSQNSALHFPKTVKAGGVPLESYFGLEK